MPLRQSEYEVCHSSGVGSLLLRSSNPQSSDQPNLPETAYLVSRHMKVNVVSDQVLLRSHVLYNIASQLTSIKVTTTQRTDKSLKDRS